MKYHTRKLEIDSKDPFKHDLLGRAGYAETLFKIIKNHKQPLTIALDDQWGNGKSTFALMWERFLRNQGVPCVYIDTFKCDYYQDPFAAIAGAIIRYEKSILGDVDSEFGIRYKKLAERALMACAPYALSLATAGTVPSGLTEKIFSKRKKFFSSAVESAIAADLSRDTLINDFKSSLSRLATRIQPALSPHDIKQPLVIIVDELDRCRPLFAIELLEKIKYFFDAENVIFLLAVNRRELASSVQSVYGSENGERFLDKFVNFSFSLSFNHNRDKTITPVDAFVAELYEYHEIIPDKLGNSFHFDNKDFSSENIKNTQIKIVQEWARRLNLSLRQIQHIFINLSILHEIIDESSPCFEWLLFVSSLKVYDRDLFEGLANNSIKYNELDEKLNLSNIEIVIDDGKSQIGNALSLAGLMKLGIKFSVVAKAPTPLGTCLSGETVLLAKAIRYFSDFVGVDSKLSNIDTGKIFFSEASRHERALKVIKYARALERFDI